MAALVCALAAAPARDARAQAYYLNDEFQPFASCDTGTPYNFLPANWSRFDVDGLSAEGSVGYVHSGWIIRPNFVDGVDECVAFSTSYYVPAGQSNDFLCTRPILLPPHSLLTWRARVSDARFPDGYEVRAMNVAPSGSTGNAGNLLAASTLLMTVAAENPTWTQRAINLHDFGFGSPNGATATHVCFRNNSTDQFLLLVDDIRIEDVTTDYAVRAPADGSLPYSRVPAWAGFALRPSLEVENSGRRVVHDVVPSFAVLHNGVAQPTLETAAIDSLTPGQRVAIDLPAEIAIEAPGSWALRYGVRASETDGYAVNSALDTDAVVAGDDELARHQGDTVGRLGIGTGDGGEIGQDFELPVSVSARGIRYTMLPSDQSGWAGTLVEARLRAFDPITGKPGAIIAGTEPWLATAEGGTVDAPFFGGPVLLPAGRYVATVVEPAAAAPMTLGVTRERFTIGRTWVNINLHVQGWVNLESFGPQFRETPQVSLLLDPPSDALFGDGFEARVSTVVVRAATRLREPAAGPSATRPTGTPALRLADAPLRQP